MMLRKHRDSHICYFGEQETSLPTQILEGTWGWSLRQWGAILELLHKNLDGLVELLIFAGLLTDWVIVEQDVRVNAMVLDEPLAGLGAVVGEEWYAHVGSVHERQRAADADDAAPGTGSNDGTEVVGLP